MSDSLQPRPLARFFCLAAILVLSIGFSCGCADQPSVAVVQEDPAGEFEWGMTRLQRALRLFRPSGVDGLNVTERKVEYELIPPDDQNSNYTARVTIVSETSFLHGKRLLQKEEKSAAQAALEFEDPLAEETDEYRKLIELPGTGPQAPAVAPTRIEPRSLDSKTVFELAYVQGHWKLTQTPEKKHEQLWFEYAFD